MAFRMTLRELSHFCRQLSVMLEAGLPISQALAVSHRGAPRGLKPVYRRLREAVEGGDTFHQAMDREGRRFPVLLKHMVVAGEQVGRLDSVLKRAADYYEFVRSVWQKFIVSLIWPIFEYLAAVGVISLATYILGMIRDDPNAGRNAAIIAVIGLGGFFLPIIGYFAATRFLGGARVVHEILMFVPVIGNVMRTLALGRFAWCMEMMTDAGIPIFDALRWSAQATGNAVFIARADRMVEAIKGGETLSAAMQQSRLFPVEFQEMILVGETAGSMSEMFGRLARLYFERTDAVLKAIGQLMFWVIWIIVACIIIYFIFTMAGMIGQSIRSITPGGDL